MNANELADKLLEDLREVDLFNMDSVYYGNRKHYIDQLESLVRQQQAEIEALKKEAALQRLSDFTQEAESFDRTASHMAGEYVSYNEPVAWMWEQEINGLARETVFLTYRPWNENAIPLYTHPAKTLTDEEILEEAQSYGMGEKFIQDAPLFHAIKFARAIEKRIRNGYK